MPSMVLVNGTVAAASGRWGSRARRQEDPNSAIPDTAGDRVGTGKGEGTWCGGMGGEVR